MARKDAAGKIRGTANGVTLSSGGARNATVTLLATGLVLVSPPVSSQGAIGAGAPAPTPQPRVSMPQPASTPAVIPPPQAPQNLPAPGGGGKGAPAAAYSNKSEPVIIYNGRIATPGAASPDRQRSQAPVEQQERSKAPLPAGYAYDATGRIVYVGK